MAQHLKLLQEYKSKQHHQILNKMLKLLNLQKKYTTDEVETTALAGIDLHIYPGEFVTIMEPSGCAKFK